MITRRHSLLRWLRDVLYPLALLFTFASLSAGTVRQDSLRTISAAHPTDTLGFEAQILLARSFFGTNLDSVLAIGQRTRTAAQIANNAHYHAEAENCLGIARLYQSDNAAALYHFQEVLRIRERLGDKKLISGAANNVAIANQELGNFSVALDYHIYSLRIKEELKDSARIRVSYNNIGLIYENLEDFQLARSYYRRAMDFLPGRKDSLDYLTTLYNIGVTYFKEHSNDSARLVFTEGYPLAIAYGDQRMIALHEMNLGALDQRAEEYAQAQIRIKSALEKFQNLGKQDMIVSSWSYLGINHLRTGNPAKALQYCRQAWELARDSGNLDKQTNCLDCMHRSQAALGQLSAAYQTAMQYNALRDSLARNDVHKEVVRQVMAYDYEKRQQADSLEAAQRAELLNLKFESQLKRREAWLFFLLVCGALILGLAILFYINFRNRKRQNQILEVRVKARTQELIRQKDQLAEYAFINAHLMRHPLTQIMGLVPLIRDAKTKTEQDQFLDMLEKASQKLDGVIHEVRDLVDHSS